jgi:hypothetical protein
VADVVQGPISKALSDRAPFGPMERLDPQRLRAEQQTSLNTPRRRASLSARALFVFMDVVYGKPRTLEKFRVLELVARVPYQAWENVAYVAVTHTASEPNFARRIFDRVRSSRWEQDNEQWHLLILEELLSDQPAGSWFKRRLLPQLLAFGYYQLSWLMYVINPKWSYRLNADFEDHAEHEYAHLVLEHPEWGSSPSRPASVTTLATTSRWPICSARSATTSGCTNCRARPPWPRRGSRDRMAHGTRRG